MLMSNSNTKEPIISVSPSPGVSPPPINVNLRDKIFIVGSQSLGVLTLLILVWVHKYILQPRLASVKRTLSLPLEVDRSINQMLGNLLEKSNASRVMVAQFHNGQKYYSGYSYEKLTMTHEAVENGVSAFALTLRDIPLSFYSEEILLAKKNKEYNKITFITPDTLVNSTSKQRMLRNGVEGYYCFMLQTEIDGEVRDIGVIFIQYLDLHCVREITSDMSNLIATIESYLSPNESENNVSKLFGELFGVFNKK